MRTPKVVLAIALLLGGFSALAQELYHPPDLDLMARISYDDSGAVHHEKIQRVCFAVFRDGEYRIARSLDNGQMQRIQGKMSDVDLSQLSKLLEASAFRKLSGYHGGLVRQEAETFTAEIPESDRSLATGPREWPEDKSWHLQWLNGDGENPFPTSVSKVVDWLEQFQPKDGKSFEYADYPDVCPRVGLRFIQPSVAENSKP